MTIVTFNPVSNEGTAFEIPQLDGGARHGCAPASAVSAAEEADVVGARKVADPATSMAASLSNSLTELQSRMAKAEERASKAEQQLAAHQRHCICRAEAVAAAIACEAADGDATLGAATR